MKLLAVFLLFHYFPLNLAFSCDSKPKGASGAPNLASTKFRIIIVTNPEKYTPFQTYNVILQGKNSVVEEANQFNGFSLKVEPANMDNMKPSPGPLAAGLLQIIQGDVNTKIDETCPNMVVHTSHTFVSSIEVLWRAPPAGSGCVVFRASVMEQNIWYQNGGGLTLELCEDDNIKNNDMIEKCCACNEAKYEMKFEGLWTRQSHPLYFPTNVWMTRFSDVIGASHVAGYRFWKVGEFASRGLIEFLEEENTTTLETEIKSNETRTVIKAKGLTYPSTTGKTFAVFRVDPDHHLLSIISIIIPSPDWFVGISGLELCDSKCEWIAEKKLDLYPYDMGLYADLKYTSRENHTQEQIMKIDHASIYESPFHTNNTEKLKPLARLYLTRSRIYERNCSTEKPEESSSDDQLTRTSFSNVPYNAVESGKFEPSTEKIEVCTGSNCGPKLTDFTEKDCTDAPWSDLSSCSTRECDPERVRGKFRLLSEEARQFCSEKSIPVENLRYCTSNCSPAEQKRLSEQKIVCEVTPWSLFSSCDSNTCIRKRSRQLRSPEKKKDRTCSRMVFDQIIECSKSECTQKSKFNRKTWRRKSSRKYNVSISASYSYIIEQDPKLCNNSTNA